MSLKLYYINMGQYGLNEMWVGAIVNQLKPDMAHSFDRSNQFKCSFSGELESLDDEMPKSCSRFSLMKLEELDLSLI